MNINDHSVLRYLYRIGVNIILSEQCNCSRLINCAVLFSFHPDYVWNLQHPSYVRRHPGRTFPLRLRSYHWYRLRLRWWCLPHSTHLWRLCSSSRHPASGSCWSWSHRLPHEDPHRERILFHHNRWVLNLNALKCPYSLSYFSICFVSSSVRSVAFQYVPLTEGTASLTRNKHI